jgi:hypothetical protein
VSEETALNPENRRVILTGDARTVSHASARRTRRSFLVGGIAAAAGYGAWRSIDRSAPAGRLQGALRRMIDFDADVNRAVWGERGLAPTYNPHQVDALRTNGTVGMDDPLKPGSWRLQLVGSANAANSPHFAKDVTAWEYQYTHSDKPSELAPDFKTPPKAADSAPAGESLADKFNKMAQSVSGKRNQGTAEAGPSYSSLNIGTPGLLLPMDELQKLPKVELITQFKCIEGWSQIRQWSGYRLRDLMDLYPPEKVNGREPRYVYMETPDGDYYVGYDLKAARHPQSLLVTEMSGQPLTEEHGAPLRLHSPIKYGYKQIKRIGLIAYTDLRPDDYWEKLGYDWYAGL